MNRPQIIAFTGPMFSGKTTAAKHTVSLLKHKAKILKIAQPLYDIQDYVYQRINRICITKDRELLQYLGTDWARKKFGSSLWIDLWFEEATNAKLRNPDHLIVVDDVRFLNEALKIKEAGGVIVGINSTQDERGERGPLINTGHISEQGFSSATCDYFIDNHANESAFKEAVEDLLKSLGFQI